ncbi:MAG: hypothetical protein HWD85_06105 [Flavobacteriaceae bacterium]|nr:hypothetical protein [Flavobacteriaceae bacterium]
MNLLIHSSLDHKDKLLDCANKFKNIGLSIIFPELKRFQHIRDKQNNQLLFNKIKNKLSIENIKNVEKCDYLLIVNPNHRGIENYIGGNSFLEMVVAFYLKKPIFLTNPIPENLPYTEEIKSFFPLVICLKNITKKSWENYVKTAYIR